VGQYDEGQYVLVLPVTADFKVELNDPATSPLQTALSLDGPTVLNWINVVTSRPDFASGLLLISYAQVAKEFAVVLPDLPPNWHLFAATLQDWLLICRIREIHLRWLWKLSESIRQAQSSGIQLEYFHDLLALLSFWIRHRGRLIPSDVNLQDNHKLVVLTPDFGYSLRRDIRHAFDCCTVKAHSGAKFRILERYEPYPIFVDSLTKSAYRDPSSNIGSTLRACVTRGWQFWWLECVEPVSSSPAAKVKFDLWKSLLEWIKRIAAVLGPAMAETTFSSLLIQLELPGLEAWSFVAGQPFRSYAPAGISIDRARVFVRITLPEGFFSDFFRPENSAERGIVRNLLIGIRDVTNLTITDDQIDSLVSEVVPNEDIRFFHIFQSSEAPLQDRFTLEGNPNYLTDIDEGFSVFAIGFESNAFQNPSELRGKDNCRQALEKLTEYIWQRIEDTIHQFARRSVLEFCLLQIEELAGDEKHWEFTSRALLASSGDGDQALSVILNRKSQQEFASLANRILIEIAQYAGSCESPRKLAKTGHARLQQDLHLLLSAAYRSFAISKELSAPMVKCLPNGEVEFDDSFLVDVVQPFVSRRASHATDAAVKKYDDLFDTEQAVNVSAVARLGELNEAFKSEYRVSFQDLLQIANRLFREGLKKGTSLLYFSHGELKTLVQEVVALTSDEIDALIERFTLPIRSGRFESLPSGVLTRDVEPWRYRRQLSLLVRPLLQTDSTEQVTWLVSPSFLWSAWIYVGSHIEQGVVPTSFFRSAEMKQFVAQASNRRGKKFTEKVASVFQEKQFRVLQNKKMAELGVTASDEDSGDVDVLAWKEGAGKVYVVECKSYVEPRSVGEIISRLETLGSEVRDDVRKHWKRTSLLKANPTTLATRIGCTDREAQILPLFVTAHLMPMNLVSNFELAPECFLSVEELKEKMNSL
jgi:hypothetical protein